MIAFLFGLQWLLALAVILIGIGKARQIMRDPESESVDRDALIIQGQRLMQGLYALRLLPSIAMTLGMLVAMLDLAQLLAGMGMTEGAITAGDQKEALQHAFFAIGLAMATAAAGLGAGSWLRARTQQRLRRLQDRIDGMEGLASPSN